MLSRRPSFAAGPIGAEMPRMGGCCDGEGVNVAGPLPCCRHHLARHTACACYVACQASPRDGKLELPGDGRPARAIEGANHARIHCTAISASGAGAGGAGNAPLLEAAAVAPRVDGRQRIAVEEPPGSAAPDDAPSGGHSADHDLGGDDGADEGAAAAPSAGVRPQRGTAGRRQRPGPASVAGRHRATVDELPRPELHARHAASAPPSPT